MSDLAREDQRREILALEQLDATSDVEINPEAYAHEPHSSGCKHPYVCEWSPQRYCTHLAAERIRWDDHASFGRDHVNAQAVLADPAAHRHYRHQGSARCIEWRARGDRAGAVRSLLVPLDRIEAHEPHIAAFKQRGINRHQGHPPLCCPTTQLLPASPPTPQGLPRDGRRPIGLPLPFARAMLA